MSRFEQAVLLAELVGIFGGYRTKNKCLRFKLLLKHSGLVV